MRKGEFSYLDHIKKKSTLTKEKYLYIPEKTKKMEKIKWWLRNKPLHNAIIKVLMEKKHQNENF